MAGAPAPEATTWYAPKDLASKMGLKASTVYGAIKRGELQASCLNGRHYVICAEWAREWVTAGVERAAKMRSEWEGAREKVAK